MRARPLDRLGGRALGVGRDGIDVEEELPQLEEAFGPLGHAERRGRGDRGDDDRRARRRLGRGGTGRNPQRARLLKQARRDLWIVHEDVVGSDVVATGGDQVAGEDAAHLAEADNRDPSWVERGHPVSPVHLLSSVGSCSVVSWPRTGSAIAAARLCAPFHSPDGRTAPSLPT